jgi:hypothetical protein
LPTTVGDALIDITRQNPRLWSGVVTAPETAAKRIRLKRTGWMTTSAALLEVARLAKEPMTAGRCGTCGGFIADVRIGPNPPAHGRAFVFKDGLRDEIEDWTTEALLEVLR